MSFWGIFFCHFGALGEVSEIEGSWGTLIFKNGRPASTGARCWKPVRARTGSELLRERMLSRRIEKRAATDSEQMRQETIGIIKRSGSSFSYMSARGHNSERASQLQSTRARVHENMRAREHEGSRARTQETITS